MKKSVLIFIFAMLLLLSSCGKKTPSDNSVNTSQTTDFPDNAVSEKGEETVMKYDFSAFANVTITGADPDAMSDDELSVLYVQARYCQAMTDANIDVMREIVSEDMTFTHMSGLKQTREEYFADIADGSLTYFTIGIENPVIHADGDKASVTFTSVLNANAYGAHGTYRMKGTHHYEKRGGEWIAVNG
jgi:hypothetical protein